ncbi:hypothetical protein P154DRAFT_529188 [Amniculicola lignicola CBS 123094]|uniref:BZIP domain-containing protein n=1 Tax=Amniculicola lignicola CBS 123094 TaxID=1392246 RepID=A0A6A5X3Z2_9PLEO|nr:hypothetical protein P154DRAFT_529188 [Amniculicola lignicola CBS 123094]
MSGFFICILGLAEFFLNVVALAANVAVTLHSRATEAKRCDAIRAAAIKERNDATAKQDAERLQRDAKYKLLEKRIKELEESTHANKENLKVHRENIAIGQVERRNLQGEIDRQKQAMKSQNFIIQSLKNASSSVQPTNVEQVVDAKLAPILNTLESLTEAKNATASQTLEQSHNDQLQKLIKDVGDLQAYVQTNPTPAVESTPAAALPFASPFEFSPSKFPKFMPLKKRKTSPVSELKLEEIRGVQQSAAAASPSPASNCNMQLQVTPVAPELTAATPPISATPLNSVSVPPAFTTFGAQFGSLGMGGVVTNSTNFDISRPEVGSWNMMIGTSSTNFGISRSEATGNMMEVNTSLANADVATPQVSNNMPVVTDPTSAHLGKMEPSSEQPHASSAQPVDSGLLGVSTASHIPLPLSGSVASQASPPTAGSATASNSVFLPDRSIPLVPLPKARGPGVTAENRARSLFQLYRALGRLVSQEASYGRRLIDDGKCRRIAMLQEQSTLSSVNTPGRPKSYAVCIRDTLKLYEEVHGGTPEEIAAFLDHQLSEYEQNWNTKLEDHCQFRDDEALDAVALEPKWKYASAVEMEMRYRVVMAIYHHFSETVRKSGVATVSRDWCVEYAQKLEDNLMKNSKLDYQEYKRLTALEEPGWMEYQRDDWANGPEIKVWHDQEVKRRTAEKRRLFEQKDT